MLTDFLELLEALFLLVGPDDGKNARELRNSAATERIKPCRHIFITALLGLPGVMYDC